MAQPPRTTLPDARTTPRFAGIATFCRFPRIDDVTAPHQLPVDWAVYGIPFDGGVTFRPGARFAPRAIREASQYMKPAHLELDVNIAEHLSCADAGDAPIQPYDCKATLDTAAAFAGNIGEPSRTKLLAIGGDHSIAFANIRATCERCNQPKDGLALLHFDAHLDTVDTVWGHEWTHASPFRRAIEAGMINPSNMLSIGIRGPLNSLSDLDYAREHGIEIITADACMNIERTTDQLSAFLDRVADQPLYLSFDIDCIDPAFAPGTGTPCCGGLTPAVAFSLLRQCARHGVNLLGADIVEVLPDRDSAGITALLASHLMIEILAISACRARKQQ
ncbi:MAG: agmatinase [Phycisphaerales bacterium]